MLASLISLLSTLFVIAHLLPLVKTIPGKSLFLATSEEYILVSLNEIRDATLALPSDSTDVKQLTNRHLLQYLLSKVGVHVHAAVLIDILHGRQEPFDL